MAMGRHNVSNRVKIGFLIRMDLGSLAHLARRDFDRGRACFRLVILMRCVSLWFPGVLPKDFLLWFLRVPF